MNMLPGLLKNVTFDMQMSQYFLLHITTRSSNYYIFLIVSL